jgi:hypothetical protein
MGTKTSEEIFVSYKSEDVAVARAVAEALMATGTHVWFAEYQILLDDRHRFEEVLDQALHRCTKAIALTNDRYARSPYCDKEIRTLLDTIGPKNVVEVMIPREPQPHCVHPRLEGAYSATWHGSLYALLDELSGLKFCDPASPLLSGGDLLEPKGKRLRIAVPKVSLGTAAWTSLAGSPWSQGQTIYARHVGSSELRVHVLVNLIGQMKRSRQDHGILDDRQVFNQNLEAASSYRNEIATAYLHQRLLGVHLLFALGYSHFAMTYEVSPVLIHHPKRIHRKYVLTFSEGESGEDAEIIITASVSGATRLSEFLPYVPLFDQFVNSIAWD